MTQLLRSIWHLRLEPASSRLAADSIGCCLCRRSGTARYRHLTILNRMVKYHDVADALAVVYSALGDPTRRGIVERLARGELTVAEIRRPLHMSAPAVSKHLRVLEHAGLVGRRRSGRHQVCILQERPLIEAGRWIELQIAFWSGSLDSLASYLSEEQ
jgi:DNA-binding transcriptional ArsR family regulator